MEDDVAHLAGRKRVALGIDHAHIVAQAAAAHARPTTLAIRQVGRNPAHRLGKAVAVLQAHAEAVFEFVFLRLLDGQVVLHRLHVVVALAFHHGLHHESAHHHGDELQSGGAIFAHLRPVAMRAVFLNENERRATGEHRHKRRGLEIGMECRHGREQAVVGRKVALPIAVIAAIEHVGVGKFNTLRIARGTRGENNHGRIERVDVD